MPDGATRRARMRQRLQLKHRAQHTPDPSTLTPSQLETLCKTDTTTLVRLIDTITPLGFAHLKDVPWHRILLALQAGVEQMLEYQANRRREVRYHVQARDNNSQEAKAQAIEEARVLLRRVKPLIEQLPEGMRCADLRALGFRPMEDLAPNAVARTGARGDFNSETQFMAAVADIERLGLRMDPVVRYTVQHQMDADQKALVLNVIGVLVQEHRVDLQQEEADLRETGASRRVLGAFEQRKKEHGVVLGRLEKWLRYAEEQRTVDGFELRIE